MYRALRSTALRALSRRGRSRPLPIGAPRRSYVVSREVILEGAEMRVALVEEQTAHACEHRAVLSAQRETDCEHQRRDAWIAVVHLMVADAEAERAVVGVRHTSRVMPEMLDPKPQRVDRVHAEDYQQPIGERRLQDPIGRGSAKPRKCHAAAPAAPHFLANAVEVVHNREQLVERVKPARAPEQALAERGPVGIAHLVRTAVMQAMHHLI